jgi:hypothetical protein
MQSWPPGVIAQAVFFLEAKVGKVLRYGVVGVDHLIQVKAYPESNGRARVLRDELQMGGEAVNTAVRLSQLDIPVTLMGNPVGSDDSGVIFWIKLPDTTSIVGSESGKARPVVYTDGERRKRYMHDFLVLLGI